MVVNPYPLVWNAMMAIKMLKSYEKFSYIQLDMRLLRL